MRQYQWFGWTAVLLTSVLARPSSAQSLRQAADRIGFLMGSAVRPSQFSEPAYASTLAREFNLIEPEDVFKWWVVRANPSGFDFRASDEVVRFAEAHHMKVRGHCLVWGRTNPEWLTKAGYTPPQLSQILQDHISTVMKHYAGKVFAWDVVNEALDENGELRDSIWYNQPGIGLAGKETAYIAQAFRWARAADPQALLFYNDNGGEGLGRKSNAIYAMVEDFKHRGVPIDGVGLQMHLSVSDVDVAAIASNITRLTTLGLQVHITEMDVALPVDGSGGLRNAEDLQRQAGIYRGVLRACLENPGCTALQTWGFTDMYSWIGSSSRGSKGWGLPFDRSYKPKPAYDALRDALAAGRVAKR